MRHVALLLGMLLTAGSTYVLRLAVGSAGFERFTGGSASSTVADAPLHMDIWYGGMLPPITIEARRGAPPAAALAWIRLIEGSKTEASCTRAMLSKTPAALRETRRVSIVVAL